jgi:hypothetical protein
MARGLLDVMGARDGGRAARGELLCGPLVCGETHAGGAGRVDGAPHERMTELEPPRHLGRADEVASHELVQPRERLGFGIAAVAAARSNSNGSPATAAAWAKSRTGPGSRSSSAAMAAVTADGTPARRPPPLAPSGVLAGSLRASWSR